MARTWDDYLIPGTQTLRNKFTSPGNPFGEPDPVLLGMLENTFTGVRLTELAASPIPGRFDYDHMKAIHHHIFQDVYEWAGEEREVTMVKAAPDVVNYPPGDPAAPLVNYPYVAAGPGLSKAADTVYASLNAHNLTRGLKASEFIPQLAEHWGVLNAIHTFREGNTRSQFAFFTQFCQAAGFRLDAPAFKAGGPLREEFVGARFYAQATGRTDRLAAVLAKGITPLAPTRTQSQTLAQRISSRAQQARAQHPPQGPQPPTPGRGRTP